MKNSVAEVGEGNVEIYRVTDDEGEKEEEVDVNVEDDKGEFVRLKHLVLSRYMNGIWVRLQHLQYAKDKTFPEIIDFYNECSHTYGDKTHFVRLEAEEPTQAYNGEAEGSIGNAAGTVNEADLQSALSTKQTAGDPLYKAICSISDRLSLQHILADPRSYLKDGGNDQFYDKNDPFFDDNEMYRELNWKTTLEQSSGTSDDEESANSNSVLSGPHADMDAVESPFERALVLDPKEFRCDNIPHNDVPTVHSDSEREVTFDPEGWRSALKYIPSCCIFIFERLQKRLESLPDLEVETAYLWKIMKEALSEIFKVLVQPEWLMQDGKLRWEDSMKGSKKEWNRTHSSEFRASSKAFRISSAFGRMPCKTMGIVPTTGVEKSASIPSDANQKVADNSRGVLSKLDAVNERPTVKSIVSNPPLRFVEMDLQSLLRLVRCFKKITNAVPQRKLCSYWISLMSLHNHSIFCKQEDQFLKLLKASRLFESGKKKYTEKVRRSIKQWRNEKIRLSKGKQREKRLPDTAVSSKEPFVPRDIPEASNASLSSRGEVHTAVSACVLHSVSKATTPQPKQVAFSGFQNRYKIRQNALIQPFSRCFGYIAEDLLKYAYLNNRYKVIRMHSSTLLFETVGSSEARENFPSTSKKLSNLLEAMFKRRYNISMRVPEEFIADVLKCYKELYPLSSLRLSDMRKRRTNDSQEEVKRQKLVGASLKDASEPHEIRSLSNSNETEPMHRDAPIAQAIPTTADDSDVWPDPLIIAERADPVLQVTQGNPTMAVVPPSSTSLHSEAILGAFPIDVPLSVKFRGKKSVSVSHVTGRGKGKGDTEKIGIQRDIRDLYKNKFQIMNPNASVVPANTIETAVRTIDPLSPSEPSEKDTLPRREREARDSSGVKAKDAALPPYIEVIDVDSCTTGSSSETLENGGTRYPCNSNNLMESLETDGPNAAPGSYITMENGYGLDSVGSLNTDATHSQTYSSSASYTEATSFSNMRESCQEKELLQVCGDPLHLMEVPDNSIVQSASFQLELQRLVSWRRMNTYLKLPIQLELWYCSSSCIGSVVLLLEYIYSLSRQDVAISDAYSLQRILDIPAQRHIGFTPCEPFLQTYSQKGASTLVAPPISTRFLSLNSAIGALRKLFELKGLYLLHDSYTSEAAEPWHSNSLEDAAERETFLDTKPDSSSAHSAAFDIPEKKLGAVDDWTAWKLVKLKGKPSVSLYDQIENIALWE